METPPGQGPVPDDVDLFDAYFKRADLNGDGWISGEEAVDFFRGSNLDKSVLSQIWNYANPNGRRFLGRYEFYNSLKLVTVAQSKRELTPDIVKAAIYGPASAKIPAPQINLPAIHGPQSNPFVIPQDGPGAPSCTGSVPVSSGLDPVSAATLSSTNQEVTVYDVSKQWPRLTQSDIRKYTDVFLKVDKDKDGKITGKEARDLFLSWKLPREILIQVWDLADEDKDSMLSLREFCIAVYLMERYREGCSFPSVLPCHIMYDFPPAFQDGSQKTKVPVLEKHPVDQLSEGETKSLNSKLQEATEADKKVEELEKDIKESREKMDFYHAKMQELVLYKSRCDARLNETTARASADKHEVELLAKKYEEKCRQTSNVASRLTIEEGEENGYEQGNCRARPR